MQDLDTATDLQFRYFAETEGSKTEDDVFWPRNASKQSGKGYDAGMRRGNKEERSSKEEAGGGNTHDVRDEPGGAEG